MAVWSTIPVSETRRCFGRFDAEYYRPEYLQNDDIISHHEVVALRQTISKLDVGHVGPMVRHYSDDGVLFLQTQNVRSYFLDMVHSVRIDKAFHESLPKSMVRKNNILLARSGSFGTASIYLEDDIINAADIIIVDIAKDGGIDPLYLVAFMNSTYGIKQLFRFASGGVQGHVNLRILENFKIPNLHRSDQKLIATFITKAYAAKKKSESSYSAAERMLAEALKLDDLKLERPLSYTAKFSDVLREGRTDADYFQVPYVQMHKHLDKLNTVRLSALVDFAKGIEVGSGAYVDEGKLFMRVSNLTVRGLKFNTSDRFVSESTYELLKSTCQPKVGELLLTKDGSPGVCWVVDREIEALMSGAIVRMSLKNREVPAEYLALAINSKLCQMQVEQNASGALILHWKLPLIKRLRVPLCDQETMKAIAKLVKESKKQQAKSEALLAEAKAMVERLIEAAAERT